MAVRKLEEFDKVLRDFSKALDINLLLGSLVGLQEGGIFRIFP